MKGFLETTMFRLTLKRLLCLLERLLCMELCFVKFSFLEAYLKFKLVIFMYHLMKHKILKNLYHEKHT